MKKKGLIISTIVMVVVLIASLTTATYAWFSQSARTTVDALELQVNSMSAVAIGARTGAGTSQNHYMYGKVTLGRGAADAVTANSPTYTGGTTGLGTSLGFTTGGTLTLSKAVNTAASVTKATAPTSPSAAFNPQGNVIYAASSGDDDEHIDNSTVNFAEANKDYVVLNMGAQAAQSGVYGIYATVKVSTTDTSTTLKMMAAMHFYIRVYDKGSTTNYKWVEFDLFGEDADENVAKSSVGSLTAPISNITYSVEGEGDAAQATATFSFLIGGVDHIVKDGDTITSTELKTNGTEIYMFDIYSYIWGPDENCVSDATGAGAKFEIEFNKVGNTDTTVPVQLIPITTAYSA